MKHVQSVDLPAASRQGAAGHRGSSHGSIPQLPYHRIGGLGEYRNLQIETLGHSHFSMLSRDSE